MKRTKFRVSAAASAPEQRRLGVGWSYSMQGCHTLGRRLQEMNISVHCAAQICSNRLQDSEQSNSSEHVHTNNTLMRLKLCHLLLGASFRHLVSAQISLVRQRFFSPGTISKSRLKLETLHREIDWCPLWWKLWGWRNSCSQQPQKKTGANSRCI